MKRYVSIYKFVIVIVVVAIFAVCGGYKYAISPVSKNDKEVIFEVTENSTYLTIAEKLKENNLIRSINFYKVYIKIFKPNNLQKGTYKLNENMGVKGIIDKLESNDAILDTTTFTIPEGKHIKDVAEVLATKTEYTKEEWLEYWNSEEFISEVITKYWFITDDVKDSNLRYNLEGYFFPATYEIFKNSNMEEISYKMLDKMDEVLSKYKAVINESEYSIHNILTLASIVEYEAILDKDRPMVAKVFLNRLDLGMKLESCATVGYALDDWKLSYSFDDLKIDSPYNTYMYYGIPVGPGGLAGEASIKAVLYPDDNDYLYFLANVYDSSANKTYYSKTYSEHKEKCLLYLGRSC